ncbi:MAG TPA: cupin domain-containing protein [Deltaproteobacteria bacterium]|nr:cupin domain-containing protein [Deltaproteobacteria bacterium]
MRVDEGRRPPSRRHLALFTVALFVLSSAGCATPPGSGTADAIAQDSASKAPSYRDIDPSLWIESPETRALDPHDGLIQPFRDRKARDRADPEAPPAFEGEDRIAKEVRATDAPWDPLEAVLPLDWDTIERLDPDGLEALRRSVRFRRVLSHPDFQIVEVALAGGARLPAHALAEPSAFHVLSGEAEFEVADESIEATVGTTVKVEPYEVRAIRSISPEPLRALWFRWAPGGDETYLDFGYYLTGTNFHVQPLEATFPENWSFWPEALRRPHRVEPRKTPDTPSEPAPETNEEAFLARQRQALGLYREALSPPQPLYPTSPRASDETKIPWIDFSNIAAAGFFWAGDAAAAGHYLDRWNEIARMKGIFQARNPGGRYDFNFSYIALGPMAKYVTHSHATPEFYYVLDGETEWIIEGDRFVARAGHVYFHSPYDDHEMRGLLEGVPMRAITGSWAPFGDRSVWKQPGFLLEGLPDPDPAKAIPDTFDFHRFPRETVRFPEAGHASDRR